ncbi:unnamed protein product [Prorocentrum cordatum]|uniref:Uncharacterized protein n=1 Tax=Prorocentrum cordatum TaxID=2364126 RepID=A0ABN9V5B2_9DINO|nr:unnamed protein product [Polarella glacialis]
MLHLKPVPRAGDEGHLGGIVLAEFGECGLAQDDAWSLLHFKRCQPKQDDLARGRRTIQLSGGFADAKSLKLHGRYVPQPRENQQTSDCRYLVGLQGTGSRRLYIAEAEMYSLERVLPEAEVLNPGGAKKNFTELRTKAVEDLGTATAARQQKATVKQREQEVKAADFGAIAASLGERAQAQQDAQVSIEERLSAATRRVMPRFDAEALSPKDSRRVWAPALEQLAPQSCRAEVPASEKLFGLLRGPPQRVLDQQGEVEEACPNSFVREILLSIAKHRRENNKKAVATEERARDLVFYLVVVECLSKLFVHKRRPINIRTAAECSGLHEDSEILRCWFDYCFEPVPGRKSFEKKLSCRKLLIATVILGLCQTPDASMALPKDVEDDLCSGPHIKRKDFMNELEAMGGYAKKLAKGSDTLLIGLKSIPQEKVFIQGGKKRKRAEA